MPSIRAVGRQAMLAFVAVAAAIACYVLFMALAGVSVLLGFLVPDILALRIVVSVIVWLGGAFATVVLVGRAFRAFERALGQQPTQSVAGGAIGGAALGLIVGAFFRDLAYGPLASVYLPIYGSAFFGAWLGAWLHGWARSPQRAGAV